MSARLSGLTIGALSLSPSFGPDTTEYTADTTNSTNKVTATPEDGSVQVEIKLNGDTDVTNGTAATWQEGANTLTVKVANGGESKTYTVTVTKSRAV